MGTGLTRLRRRGLQRLPGIRVTLRGSARAGQRVAPRTNANERLPHQRGKPLRVVQGEDARPSPACCHVPSGIVALPPAAAAEPTPIMGVSEGWTGP